MFNKPFNEAHNATADVEATTRCFFELIKRKNYTKEQLDVQPDYFQKFSEANPKTIHAIGIKHINLKQESAKINERLQQAQTSDISSEDIKQSISNLEAVDFVHLHNHSQFSVLQSTISIPDLVAVAAINKNASSSANRPCQYDGSFSFCKSCEQSQ